MQGSSKPLAEDLFGYWGVRIRDPKIFTRIRTPDWSSHAATKMAKEWIISASQDFQVAPYLLPDDSFANLHFVRGKSAGSRSRHESEDQVHARQGQLRDGRWVTQSILVPQGMILNGTFLDIPGEIAHEIACYISERLDQTDYVEPSLTCQQRR